MKSEPFRLLIVDDETAVVDSLKSSLEAQGYQVCAAGDGIAALEETRQQEPDLILLDLMLPALDGYRVLKLLKSHNRHRHIPILVITARASAEDWTLAKECGADGYLAKPVQVERLLEQIRAHLSCREKEHEGTEAA